MTTTAETRSVIVERDFAASAEKLWRALTQPHLIEEWLMKNDFVPSVGHPFQLRGDWGTADCKVLEIEQNTKLSYSWDAMGLKSVVTLTLTPSSAGTHLRVEQSGFPKQNAQAFAGATYGWTSFLGKLDQVVAREG